jgi:hypothetical protein
MRGEDVFGNLKRYKLSSLLFKIIFSLLVVIILTNLSVGPLSNSRSHSRLTREIVNTNTAVLTRIDSILGVHIDNIINR